MRRLLGLILLLMLVGADASGQSKRRITIHVKPDTTSIERWKMGVAITAGGPVSGLVASAPVPMNWPGEQQVRFVDQEVSDNVDRMTYKTLNGGAKQLIVNIDQLGAGDTATAVVTCEVTKTSLRQPNGTSQLAFAKRPTGSLRSYLGPSPLIESDRRQIQQLAQEIVQEDKQPWQQIREIFDWVRSNIKYRSEHDTATIVGERAKVLVSAKTNIKGAIATLDAGAGDCDEMTALFVALCRARRIPARAVWVVGHSYPEFYLEDFHGTGRWFACEISGANDDFGYVSHSVPILQKGDRFRVRGYRNPLPYVMPTLQARHHSGAPPQFEWVIKKVD